MAYFQEQTYSQILERGSADENYTGLEGSMMRLQCRQGLKIIVAGRCSISFLQYNSQGRIDKKVKNMSNGIDTSKKERQS